MSQPILITGADGVVGRALSAALEQAGLPVRRFDRRRGRSRDIRDVQALTAALTGCRGVLHFAAIARVSACEAHPEEAWSVNADGTADVVSAAIRRAPAPWIVFASSREVYGDARDLPVSEDALLTPENTYARSKVAAEAHVASGRARGLRTATLRLSNVYGAPRDYPDRVIPAFLDAARAGRPLTVCGPEVTMDFVHLHDVITAVGAVIARLEAGDSQLPALNVASGEGVSLRELASHICALVGSPSQIVERPASSHAVRRYVGDASLAHATLGWRAQTPLTVGLAGLVQGAAPRAELGAFV